MHLSLPLQHFLRLLWFDKVKMRLLDFTLIIWRTQNLRNSWDVFPEAEWFPHRSPAGSRSALDSRSWILPGESPSARSVVEIPVELVTPPGQRSQAAHFWSRCLFWRALSWSSILSFVGVFQDNLSGSAVQWFQPELEFSCQTLLISWSLSCPHSLLLYHSDLFFRALFRAPQLSEPLKTKTKMNSSSFLFGLSSTSQRSFSMSARVSTASSRCFSNKETLWWRQSMSSPCGWICAVASWSSSIMLFAKEHFSSAARPSPLLSAAALSSS